MTGGIDHITVKEGEENVGRGENPFDKLPETLEPIMEPVREIMELKVAQMIGLLLLIAMALAVLARKSL